MTTKRQDERPHKTTPDLEDVTGNPGHRGVTPHQAQSMNPPPRTDGGMDSINEPPGSQRRPK